MIPPYRPWVCLWLLMVCWDWQRAHLHGGALGTRHLTLLSSFVAPHTALFVSPRLSTFVSPLIRHTTLGV
jgi:hypothetical protein